jgi:hypothetical protein
MFHSFFSANTISPFESSDKEDEGTLSAIDNSIAIDTDTDKDADSTLPDMSISDSCVSGHEPVSHNVHKAISSGSRRDVIHWLRDYVFPYYSVDKKVFIFAVKIIDTVATSGNYESAYASFIKAFEIINGSDFPDRPTSTDFNFVMDYDETADYDRFLHELDNINHSPKIPIDDPFDSVTEKTLFRYLISFLYPSNIQDFDNNVTGLYVNTLSSDHWGVKDIVSDILDLDSFLPPNTRVFYVKQDWWEVWSVENNDIVKSFKKKDIAQSFFDGCVWPNGQADFDLKHCERIKTFVYTIIYNTELKYDEECSTPTTPSSYISNNVYQIDIGQSIWNRDSKQRNWTNKIKRDHVSTALKRISKNQNVTMISEYIPTHKDIEKHYIINCKN